MGKKVDDSVPDAALNEIASSVEMYICTAEPTDRADAIALSLIAARALGPGDYTIADGDASGRKVTVAAQASIPLTGTGTADHVALCTATLLKHVTTATPQLLTSGGTVSTPAYDASEFEDPV